MGKNDKHDKTSKYGFDVDPELLAHDLAILKLQSEGNFTSNTNDHVYYDSYCETYNHFRSLVQDKIKYDTKS